MPKTEFLCPEPERDDVAEFLRELTNLSLKYKLAISQDRVLFCMEPDDYDTRYRIDDDGVVSFG